jgi:hypothetical protein
MLSRKAPCRKLPCRPLQLIREYSKPITRGDWRTFPRYITKETYANDILILDKLDKSRMLYRKVQRNMYYHLFIMTRSELLDLLVVLEHKTKYHHDDLHNSNNCQLIINIIHLEKKLKEHNNTLKQRKLNNILNKKRKLRHKKRKLRHKKRNYNET